MCLESSLHFWVLSSSCVCAVPFVDFDSIRKKWLRVKGNTIFLFHTQFPGPTEPWDIADNFWAGVFLSQEAKMKSQP